MKLTVMHRVPFQSECDQQFLAVLVRCGGSEKKKSGR